MFGMRWGGSDTDISAISMAEERLKSLESNVEVAIQSMDEFREQHQQHRPTRKNVDVSMRTYLQKPITPIKVHRNVFRRRFAFVIGMEEYMDRDKNSLSRVD